MGRSIREQLATADHVARLFVREQLIAFQSLGYPRATPFAKLMAAGTVPLRLPPTIDDLWLEAVGRFMWNHLTEIERRLILSHYAPWTTIPAIARELGMTPRTYYRRHEAILLRLDGWLRAVDDQNLRGAA